MPEVIHMRGRVVKTLKATQSRSSGTTSYLFQIGPAPRAALHFASPGRAQRSARGYVLSAQSAEERQAWLEALRKAANRNSIVHTE